VQVAAQELAAYQASTTAGKLDEAGKHLQNMAAALAKAKQLTDAGTGGGAATPPATTAPATTAPSATTSTAPAGTATTPVTTATAPTTTG
jgi:hypothetical protein